MIGLAVYIVATIIVLWAALVVIYVGGWILPIAIALVGSGVGRFAIWYVGLFGAAVGFVVRTVKKLPPLRSASRRDGLSDGSRVRRTSTTTTAPRTTWTAALESLLEPPGGPAGTRAHLTATEPGDLQPLRPVEGEAEEETPAPRVRKSREICLDCGATVPVGGVCLACRAPWAQPASLRRAIKAWEERMKKKAEREDAGG